MSSVLRLCRKCGAEIFADAPEGLCTACLFETGLNLLAGESVAEVVSLGQHEGERAPDKKKKSERSKTFADFVDGNDTGMIQTGGRFRFASESFEVRLSGPVSKADYFEGHCAVETLLPRAVNHALPPAADLLEQFIITKVGERPCPIRFLLSIR